MKIQKIQELSEKIIHFLIKRNLEKQYKKAKSNILDGNMQSADFKIRQPKKDGIYYFRINKQFQALCYLKNNTLIVYDIDDHQN